MLFCAKNYDGRYMTSTEEFEEDVNRVKYIKKLITRYIQTQTLKERLILNHIIVLNNVFGPEFTCRLLYLKLSDQFKYVIPFLKKLHIMPDEIYYVGEKELVKLSTIKPDPTVTGRLHGYE